MNTPSHKGQPIPPKNPRNPLEHLTQNPAHSTQSPTHTRQERKPKNLHHSPYLALAPLRTPARLLLCLLCMLACLSISQAKKSPRYITDSKQFSSIGIDRHDIENVVERASKKLLDSPFVRELRGQKLLAISDLKNQTKDDVDVEFLSRKIARILRSSKKFALTNAIAGSGASTDRLLKDTRKLTRDKRYNQYSTQEDGTLLAPDFSLSGKIVQRSKNVGENLRIDYDFLFVLTDLKSGRVVWDDEEYIAKVISKSEAARFAKLGSGSCEGGDVLACQKEAESALNQRDYERAEELLHRACRLGSKEACQKRSELRKSLRESKRAERRARREAREGHFGLSLGADIGMGGGSANMVPIPYTYTPSYSYYGKSSSGLILYNDNGITTNLAFPYMLQTGLWYKQKNGLYLGLHALYGGYELEASSSGYDVKCTGSSYGSCSSEGIDIDGLIFTHKLFGGGVRLGGNISSDVDGSGGFASITAFIGGGALQDVGSKMKTVGAYIINEKLENLYPFWELGASLSLNNIFYIEMTYRYMFDGAEDKSWASIGSLNIGLGLMLPVW